jgi:hypothetical protein
VAEPVPDGDVEHATSGGERPSGHGDLLRAGDERPRGHGERLIGDDEDWIAVAVALARDEARRYLGTLWRVCTAPGRFGAAWAHGRADALHPLGFLASSAALLGLVVHVCGAVLGADGDSLLVEIANGLWPYLLFAAFGVIAHPLLRRKRLRSSVAMALYAGAGPATVCAIAFMLLTTAAKRALHVAADAPLVPRHPTRVVQLASAAVMLGVPLASFWYGLVASLARLHGRSRLRAALAVAAAQLVVALLAGASLAHGVRAGGVFLPSLALWLRRDAHGVPVPYLTWWY